MIIDQSIIDRAGRVLIAKKSVLDDYAIEAGYGEKRTTFYGDAG